MFGHKHYVPILRWKLGEQIALRELFHSDRPRVTPLVELSHDEDNHPDITVRQIAKCWGTKAIFFDPTCNVPVGNFPDSARYVATIFGSARLYGLRMIPVTGLNRSPRYQGVVKEVVRTDKLGACVRLLRGDLREGSFADALNRLIALLGLQPSLTDIVIDLQVFDASDHDIGSLCSKLPQLLLWRTLTIVSGSFPKDLSHLKVGQHLQPRLEWRFWTDQISNGLPRVPTFGDYTTLHPHISTWFPGMNVSASIRYTTNDSWLIMRGEGLLNKGGPRYAQYPANAELLMLRPEYCGPYYSYGDNYIYETAMNKGKPGNPTTWLAAGVNHHITFVVRQVAAFFEAQPENAKKAVKV